MGAADGRCVWSSILSRMGRVVVSRVAHLVARTSSWASGGVDRALRVILVAMCVGIALRCAWVCDDAYITLRTVRNIVDGYGPVYNPGERVQVYTHPLWLVWLLPGYALFREAWLVPIGVGLLTSGLAVGVGLGAARTRGAALLFAGGWLLSKSIVDYATSGLENPLVNLWLALFFLEGVGPARGPRLGLLAALLALTRLDAAWLVLPALAWRPSAWRGLWPLAVWFAFALFYYGSWLPNSALAKLGTGIAVPALARQSLYSFGWMVANDPLGLVGIGAGLVAAAVGRVPFVRAMGAGIALHLLWVVWVGGDFMGGRFFVAPLFSSLLILAWAPNRGRGLAAFTGFAVALGLANPRAPVWSGPAYDRAPPVHGVVDERGYYWRATGLFVDRREPLPPEFTAREDDPPVVVKSVIGWYGYTAGPHRHVIDRLGLADPLLARLPVEDPEHWRIGHFRRAVPAGYLPSVLHDRNEITEPETRALYEAVRLATRAPLLAPGRARAILWLNTGVE